MQQKKREIYITADGSATIIIPSANLSYHSLHGAVQESMHVFIKTGLYDVIDKYDTIKIFEMGFGTGLNALLTLREAVQQQKNIEYTACELHPLSKEEYELLDYNTHIDDALLQNCFKEMHDCEWEKASEIHPLFTLYKTKTALDSFSSQQRFHLIYFDAFDPAAQPELWTKDIFDRIFAMTKAQGVLVTYSSKGNVRRALEASGFYVQKLSGPPGKREIIRAVKGPLTP